MNILQQALYTIYEVETTKQYAELITYDDLVKAWQKSITYNAGDPVAYIRKCLLEKYERKIA